jgi:hypothetical protein
MKPLGRPVDECRVFGLLAVAWGVVAAGVAIATAEDPLSVLLRVLAEGAIFGAFSYLTIVRYARSAATEAPEVSNPVCETAAKTRRRAALWSLCLLIPYTAFSLLFLRTEKSAGIIGIVPGSGAAMLVIAHWLRRWEETHSLKIFREPRWRFSRQGQFGFGRGRGTWDPRDFYAVRSD